MTKDPQIASDPHVVMIGHVSPAELRAKMTEAQLSGGTMNRTIPCASRRVRLLPHGGNLPAELIDDCCTDLAKAVGTARDVGAVTMSRGATKLWEQRYADVRRARPDGPVAKMLARAAPQVLRLALIYSLADEQQVINADHLRAALAVWQYAEKSAEWMFGTTADSAELSELEHFIAFAGKRGRSRTEISVEHFGRHKKSGEIKELLSDLVRGGQVRQESVETNGRTATRYYAS